MFQLLIDLELVNITIDCPKFWIFCFSSHLYQMNLSCLGILVQMKSGFCIKSYLFYFHYLSLQIHFPFQINLIIYFFSWILNYFFLVNCRQLICLPGFQNCFCYWHFKDNYCPWYFEDSYLEYYYYCPQMIQLHCSLVHYYFLQMLEIDLQYSEQVADLIFLNLFA